MPERKQPKRKSKAASPKAAKTPGKRPAKAAADAKPGTLSVLDVHGKTLETIAVDPILQGERVNTDVIYQAIRMYQAGEREGTAATKDRGHVRGGGKKPWRQKGTGQARHGSRRSPIWRGGGVTHGPMPREYGYTIPAKARKSAVTEVVRHKMQSGKLLLVDRLAVSAPKTREVAKILDGLKLKKPLLVVERKEPNFLLASRNIPGLSVKTAQEVNALDVALHDECVMTRGAYDGFLKRLKS